MFNNATAVPPSEVTFLIFSNPLVDINVTNIIQRIPSIPRVLGPVNPASK